MRQSPLGQLEAIKSSLMEHRGNLLKRISLTREISRWEHAGRPIPPPHLVKVNTVRMLRRRFSTPVFIETGTFMGDMVFAVRKEFQEIYSIELDSALFRAAHKRFGELDRVHILHGDSAHVLPKILGGISGRCLFWLDGHYSGGNTARGSQDSPIRAELAAIAQHERSDHVILIDDARLFDGQNGYMTIEEASQVIRNINPTYSFHVIDDMIQALPGG